MARNTKPLTNTEVLKAKAKEKEYNLADGDGLMLRVKPTGSKLWLFNYCRPFTKTRTNIGFGSYPNLSLADARLKRQDARTLLAKDIDPKTHKQENDNLKKEELNNTLRIVATNWFNIKKTTVSIQTAKDLWNSLENHILPKLGNHPINALKPVTVIETIKPIAAKGSLEVVKRLCQRINEIMTYAANTGLIDSNPLMGIKQAFESPKTENMPTLRPEELPVLMKSIQTASIKIITRALIQWQLHTMVRPSEAAGAMWSEIDLENKLWIIPAKRMKKKREHIVPMSNELLNLLKLVEPISGHREYIFPADRNPKTHTNNETANMALKRMGFKNRLVAHGMRSLASTTLNDQGFSPDLIESALAHVDKNESRRAYNHAEYLERRRTMMAWWSEHIEQAATGNFSLGQTKTLRAV